MRPLPVYPQRWLFCNFRACGPRKERPAHVVRFISMSITPQARMVHKLSLAEQLELLFAYGEFRGISSAYRAIATSTGENANNIRKIHRGANANPGLRMLNALTSY